MPRSSFLFSPFKSSLIKDKVQVKGDDDNGDNGDDQITCSAFFGQSLPLLFDNTNTIPKVIQECLSIIERNCSTEGLFRISASCKDLEDLKRHIDSGKIPRLHDDDDVHLATAIIKAFLRELPEPILGFDASKLNGSINDLVDYVGSLPQENYVIVYNLCRVLSLVAICSDKSKMDASNLAVLLGPNMLWIDCGENERVSPSIATQITFLLIQHFDTIFTTKIIDTASDGHCDSNLSTTDDDNDGDDSDDGEGDDSDDGGSAINEGDIIIAAIYELQKEMNNIKTKLNELDDKVNNKTTQSCHSTSVETESSNPIS